MVGEYGGGGGGGAGMAAREEARRGRWRGRLIIYGWGIAVTRECLWGSPSHVNACGDHRRVRGTDPAGCRDRVPAVPGPMAAPVPGATPGYGRHPSQAPAAGTTGSHLSVCACAYVGCVAVGHYMSRISLANTGVVVRARGFMPVGGIQHIGVAGMNTQCKQAISL